MATTPPPRSMRIRTPPTPLHGPQYDNYEPYSPRRSTRTTAQSNPYSSFNSHRSPREDQHQHQTTPPPTIKKARFARAPTQLSSPPSSPASPAKRLHSTQTHSAIHKTPRKQSFTPRKTTNTHLSPDTIGSSRHTTTTLAPPNPIDPTTMLPTPSKTPSKKRTAAALASTSRILTFQPNDIMPSPRKIKKQPRISDFELYDDEAETMRDGDIEIYTDANARVPQMDESEDNPFVGPKQTQRPQRGSGSRSVRKGAEEREREERIREAVARDEGVVYVFRGRKIFRRFTPPGAQDDGGDHNDPSTTSGHRRLIHQAGITAQRPITRSAIKPRLLFPSEDQQREREQALEEVDEEAMTDIEMGEASTVITPPSTTATKRRHGVSPKKMSQKDAIVEAEADTSPDVHETDVNAPDPMSVGSDPAFSDGTTTKGKGSSATSKSPFDTWARTKTGRKRAGEQVEAEEGMGKRTRSSGPVAGEMSV